MSGGHRVVVLDDLSAGRRANLDRVHDAVDLVVGSVLDRSLVHDLVGWADHVFHLASLVGLEQLRRRPGATRTVSLQGTKNVVDGAVARTAPLTSLLFTSSSEVYGTGPFVETRALRVPVEDGRGRYAHAKWMAERAVCRALRQAPGAVGRVIIARLFNTVGPRQRADQGLVLARWRDQLSSGQPVTVYGDGRQTRCFAHVDDVVERLVRLVFEPLRFDRIAHPDAHALTVNVGHDRPVQIGDLARQLVERAGGDPQTGVRHVPFERAFAGLAFRDPRDRRPDLGRLRALLGEAEPCGGKDLERWLGEIACAARGASSRALRA